LVDDGGFGGVLQIKEHDVHVTVNNGVAVTESSRCLSTREQRVSSPVYVSGAQGSVGVEFQHVDQTARR